MFPLHESLILLCPQEGNHPVYGEQPVIEDRSDQARGAAIAEAAEDAERHVAHQEPAAQKLGDQVAHRSGDSLAVYPRHLPSSLTLTQ